MKHEAEAPSLFEAILRKRKRGKVRVTRREQVQSHEGQSHGAHSVPAQPTRSARRVLPPRPIHVQGFYSSRSDAKTNNTRQDRLEDFVHDWLQDLRARVNSTSTRCEFVVFSRQKDAFEFVDKEKHPMQVFSCENGSKGWRTFISATKDAFWKHYCRKSSDKRHYYEIIREGRCCNLYLDLEYSTVKHEGNATINEQFSANERVDALLQLLKQSLEERFGRTFGPENVLELDSSKEGKFSRHIVVRLDDAAFQDAIHVGAFVKGIVGDALADPDNEKYRKLFVSQIDSEGNLNPRQGTIIDTAVYTRNRAFRLLWSSKHGKKARLLPIYRLKQATIEDDKQLFLRSLVSNVGPGCTVLSCDDVHDFAPGRLGSCKNSQGVTNGHCKTQHTGGQSPFPELDKFVISVASQSGVPAKIRSWTHFPDMAMVMYNISENRYCRRINRAHKSNNVMYIVDLALGSLYQKCLDPDCRNWRSDSIPIPSSLSYSNTDYLHLEKDDDAFWEEAFEQCSHLIDVQCS